MRAVCLASLASYFDISDALARGGEEEEEAEGGSLVEPSEEDTAAAAAAADAGGFGGLGKGLSGAKTRSFGDSSMTS
jgi:hypothetical protein